MKNGTRLFTALAVGAFAALVAGFHAPEASAQTAVAFAQQHFASHGDGSSGPTAVPCCTAMGTYDQRVTQTQKLTGMSGLYFDEFPLKRQFGTAQYQAGGTVTIPSGVFTTVMSQPLLTLPGGQLLAIETAITRTVNQLTFMAGGGIGAANIGTGDFTTVALAQGNDFFEYVARDHVPTNVPFHKTAGTWPGPPINTANPNTSFNGRIRVTPSPNQYGGTRDMVWEQFSHGFVPGSVATQVVEFFFPVRYGVSSATLTHTTVMGAGGATFMGVAGRPVTAMFQYNFTTPTFTTISTPNNTFTTNTIIHRNTAPAPFKVRAAPCCTGVTFFSLTGTGWFDRIDFTTGTIQIIANTIGNAPDGDFSTRTEMGYNSITTSGGQVFGALQLVSGGLLNSRGAEFANLAHTHNTLIKFAPEPGSAALIGAGALGLLGLAIRDRRRR